MDLQLLAPYLSVAEIILGIVMTVLVLLQTKGSGLGSFMGGSSDMGSFRTRRGVEAVMHRVTIYCSVLFFICTIFSFLAWGQMV